jgi:hypothetical protein
MERRGTTALGTALAPYGLNLVGTASVEAYDQGLAPGHTLEALMPEARTAIVIGNGGGALWDAYQSHCGLDPGWAERDHPLDDFTRFVVEERAAMALAGLGRVRLLYPFRFPEDPVSFLRLGAVAGLGRPSLLGVLVHPVYGPWMALRAAILTTARLDAPRPADGFDPCPTCTERACVSACPAAAVSERGWDVPACGAHRGRDDDPCAPRCHARFECVLGRAHRYPAAALAYHQRRARPGLVVRVPRAE